MYGTKNSNGVVKSGWNHMWRETENEDSRVRDLCKLVCERDPRMRIRNPYERNSRILTGEYGIRMKLDEDGIREWNPESECIDMGANPRVVTGGYGIRVESDRMWWGPKRNPEGPRSGCIDMGMNRRVVTGGYEIRIKTNMDGL